jgi:hypothetical protein
MRQLAALAVRLATHPQMRTQQHQMRLLVPALAVMLQGLLLSRMGTCCRPLLLLTMLLLCLHLARLRVALRVRWRQRSRQLTREQVMWLVAAAAAVVVLCSRWWMLPSQQLALRVMQ